MSDISLEEARAKIWMDDVNSELEAVEAILKKVHSSLTTTAGSDDSIMNGIWKVGTAMENAWNTLCNNFKSAQSKMALGIAKLVATAQEVIDDADALKSKIGG